MPDSSSRFSPHSGLISLVLMTLVAMAPLPSVQAREMRFTLADLDDRPVRLADFRGQWVIVNFWATWCTPCVLELPELQAFHETQRGRAVVIGVNFEELDASAIRPFINRLGITFPIALSGGKPTPGFAIKGLPTTFLISPSGQLADTHLGTVDAGWLTARLADLERAENAPR
jgi:thiol-disulfide isomerase/thioredoxin